MFSLQGLSGSVPLHWKEEHRQVRLKNKAAPLYCVSYLPYLSAPEIWNPNKFSWVLRKQGARSWNTPLLLSFFKCIKMFCLVLISLCRSFINYQVLTYLLYIVIHPAQWELQEQGLMLFLFLLPSCSCYYRYRSQEACVSKLFSSGGKSQTMPPMRCNRASLMQSKIHQFNTMEASFTLNICKHSH